MIALEKEGLPTLRLTARPVLSRYACTPEHLRADPLLVVEPGAGRLRRIEEVTDIFDRYERRLMLERVYTAPEEVSKALAIAATLGD